MQRDRRFFPWLISLALIFGACDSQTPTSPVNREDPGGSGRPTDEITCSIPADEIFASVGKDVIPALLNPTLVEADAVTYLKPEDRVLGLRNGGLILAIPHKLMGYHEIVNLDATSPRLAVTYCPLTGSGLAFDRGDVRGAEFGVSGLLYQNNLIMYDRNDVESFWVQMDRRARCGLSDGTVLGTYTVLDLTWAGWKSLYPTTKVVSRFTGHARDYNTDAYETYGEPDNGALLYGMTVDDRRSPKERVLGVPLDDGGVAFPFGALDNGASVRVVTSADSSYVVFWDRERQTAMAYHLRLQEGTLHFEVRNEAIYDQETGSQWRVDGCAVSGPRQGGCMPPVEGAYVAYWFAWAAFQPRAELWVSQR